MTTSATHLPHIALGEGLRLPAACNVAAIRDDQRLAHLALIKELFTQMVQETRALPDGMAFRFAANDYAHVTTFIANERLCCPFITFVLELPAGNTTLWLHMTGDAEVQAFLKPGA